MEVYLPSVFLILGFSVTLLELGGIQLSLARREKIMGLLDAHNHMYQFLILNYI